MEQDGTSKSPGSFEVTGDPCPDPWAARQWDAREDCEVRQILDRVADKWSLLVIALLKEGTMRFSELRREVDGISQRMLTVTLRNLERDGLVRRTVYAEVPPRVEYFLTPLGCTLLGTIEALVHWTEEHQEEVARARAEFDARAAELESGTTRASGRAESAARSGPQHSRGRRKPSDSPRDQRVLAT